MRKLLIMEQFKAHHIERLKKVCGSDFELVQIDSEDSDKVREEIMNATIVIGEPSMELIVDYKNNCPELKLIQMAWAGTDIYTRSSLDFPKEAMMLANASGAYGHTISQYVIGQILSLNYKFKKYYDQQTKKVWLRQSPIKTLDKAKVLIFGSGDIGANIARRLMAFDTYTIGVCRDTSKKRDYFNELCTLDEAEKYLSEADVVIGCIPNTIETTNYLNEDRLNLMKKDAVLVNVGRGNFIDCMALDRVLREEKLWGAALDVTNPEPLPTDHPLWDNPRAVITPHISGIGFNHLNVTEDIICDIACENIRRFINSEEIMNRVY